MGLIERFVDGSRRRATGSIAVDALAPALAELLAEPPDDAPDALSVDGARLALVAASVRDHFFAHLPEPSSLPGFATRVMSLVEDPDVDLFELSQAIEQDAAIAVKVLQVANSAFYRTGDEVHTVRAAVSRLGLFAVANLAVSVACRSLFDAGARAEYDLFAPLWNRLAHHALTCAFSAGELATHHRLGRPDHAFFGGLFHDIGKTLALRSLSALLFARALEPPPLPLVEAALEQVHVEVGTIAHERWRLPGYLTAICREHEAEHPASETAAVELHLVRVASGLNTVRVESAARALPSVRRSAAALGADAEQLRKTAVTLREVADRVTRLFAIPDPAARPV
ncbi:MAG TPA: HDOD domain-containing protein [Polyangiaceae bacterium]|nr:HDOD domain-containing protein [Polyangiaceae bacterium]